MKAKNILAFDMGSSNGRAMLGRFDGENVGLEEIHRFSNDPVPVLGSIHWDVLRLFWNINEGLKKYSASYNEPLLSVGLDAWGVDYGILDRRGRLLGNPWHYRDSRNDETVGQISGTLAPDEIFNMTGNAVSSHNTVYQLMSTKLQEPEVWERIHTVLLMPDLLSYFLTGEKAAEYTNATTMQLLDKGRAGWCKSLLECLDIPERILPPLQKPGTARGLLRPEIGWNTGTGKIPVIAVATHDTASAVSAIPDMDEGSAFISSGSWSLVGAQTERTYVNDNVRRWGFSNEGGVGDRNLLLRNTVGMWIIQECVREWNKSGAGVGFEELVSLAAAAEPFHCMIDPDNACFSMPGDMPQKIMRYCKDTVQRSPGSKGLIARCVFESLALKYRSCLEKLETILERPLVSVRIVGGGSRNGLLNQFTANAAQKPVYCGPVEATAIGNIMVQAMSLGLVENPADIRRVVKNSFEVSLYEPENKREWDEAYIRFLKLIEA